MRRLQNVPRDDGLGPEPFDADALEACVLTVADQLNALSFDVISPRESEFSYLKVMNARDALCDLTIDKFGTVDWEYRCIGREPDPALLAVMALRILSGAAPDVAVSVPADPRLSFKGRVGRVLAEAGMQVALNVQTRDEVFMDVYAEVEVTNQRRAGWGTVQVADDGAMWWHCHLHEPVVYPDGPQLDEIAATIADVLAIGQGVRQS
jgi:hypothetical protein